VIWLKRISVFVLTSMTLIMLFQINPQSFGSAIISPIVITTSCSENTTIYFLDVGQGDSILVKTPSKNILIDGGPIDAGTIVLNDLSAYHVTKIDLMVATHPHADHIGGLISVLQSSIPVQDIVYNGYNYTSTQTFNTWKSLALTHNLTQGNRNQVYAMSPTINFTIISPTSPTQFGSTINEINDNSIVMKLQVGNTSVLLTGDATTDAETSMLSSGYNLQGQVLKVGHHGSSTSTSQSFLNAVTPAYAVISSGIDNTYGHPAQQTLDKLASNSIITYGTYGYGTIVFSLNSVTQTPNQTFTPTPSPSPTTTIAPTDTPNPTIPQTQTPTPTMSTTSAPTQNPASKPSISPSTNPSPTPNIPEFPFLLFLMGLVGLISVIILTMKRQNWLHKS
jgi:competence protein ComEC